MNAAGASQHDDEEQAHQEQFLMQDLAHGAGYFRHRGHHRHPPEIVRRVLDLGDPGDQALVKPDGGIGHQLGGLPQVLTVPAGGVLPGAFLPRQDVGLDLPETREGDVGIALYA